MEPRRSVAVRLHVSLNSHYYSISVALRRWPCRSSGGGEIMTLVAAYVSASRVVAGTGQRETVSWNDSSDDDHDRWSYRGRDRPDRFGSM